MSKPKKKRTKQFNRHKSCQVVLREELKGVSLVHVPSMEGLRCNVYRGDTRIHNMGSLLVSALDDYRLYWSVCLVIASRDWDGVNYITTLQVDPTEPRTRSQLGPTLLEHHEELRASCNPKNLIATAWLASPLKHEFTDKEVYDRLDQLGLFTHPTKGEYENEQN